MVAMAQLKRSFVSYSEKPAAGFSEQPANCGVIVISAACRGDKELRCNQHMCDLKDEIVLGSV